MIPTVFGYQTYTEGKNYQAGEQVVVGTTLYECLPYPNSQWCNDGGFYAPWIGKYWRSAWRIIWEVNTTTVSNTNGYVSNSQVIANSFIPTKTNPTYPTKPVYPARPSISVLGRTYNEGNYTLNWTIPVNGKLGDLVQLYENKTLISQKAIDPTSAAKWGSFIITNGNAGTFRYNVVMCLKGNCSSSGDMEITVYNGVNNSDNTIIYNYPYLLPTNIQQIISSATPISGTPSVDTTTKSNNVDNVQRVMGIISESTWNSVFPLKNSIYSYEKFLQAVAKYPSFCWEVGTNSTYNVDTTCRRELATLLSFYAYESGLHSSETNSTPLWKQGLYYTKVPGASVTTDGNYFGRGSFLLEGETTYKYLSFGLFGDENTLLTNPSELSSDGYTSLASGMWAYMTPRNQNPSIHDIISGIWKPTSDEIRNGMETGFGAAMQALDQNLCNGSGTETLGATELIGYYKEFASVVWTSQNGSLSCKNLPEFNPVSYPVSNYFWQKQSNGDCTLGSTENNYYVFSEGSYETCRISTYSTSNTTTSTSSTTSSTTNSTLGIISSLVSNTTTSTIKNTSSSMQIPTFAKLPTGTDFNDLSQEIESSLRAKMNAGKITKTDIVESLSKFDTWIRYLSNKNNTVWLTGDEKRSLIIILVMKNVFSKYN